MALVAGPALAGQQDVEVVDRTFQMAGTPEIVVRSVEDRSDGYPGDSPAGDSDSTSEATMATCGSSARARQRSASPRSRESTAARPSGVVGTAPSENA
jgi:hypothetical protein